MQITCSFSFMKTGIQSIYKVSTTMLRISTMSRTSKHKNSQSNPSTFLAHPKMAFRRKAGGIVLYMVGIIFDEMSTSNYLQIGKRLQVWDPVPLINRF